jgi:hydrogenase maturation factor HypF (carbamoyltransferase family)
MKGKCEDCDSVTRITLAPYGMRFMAEIACPKCGVSYDTNIDDTDIEAIKKSLLKTGQEVTA